MGMFIGGSGGRLAVVQMYGRIPAETVIKDKLGLKELEYFADLPRPQYAEVIEILWDEQKGEKPETST